MPCLSRLKSYAKHHKSSPKTSSFDFTKIEFGHLRKVDKITVLPKCSTMPILDKRQELVQDVSEAVTCTFRLQKLIDLREIKSKSGLYLQFIGLVDGD